MKVSVLVAVNDNMSLGISKQNRALSDLIVFFKQYMFVKANIVIEEKTFKLRDY